MSRFVATELILLTLVLAGCSRPAPDVVRFAPTVAGQEKTTVAGRDHMVRWVQNRTDFTIDHQGSPRRVKLSFRVASHQAERHVWLEQDGNALPTRESVSRDFWEGGDVWVSNIVTLHEGQNHFTIVADGQPVDVTPGRPVVLLLIDDVMLENQS